MKMMNFFNEIKCKLGIDNVEISLINSDDDADNVIGMDFVILIADGVDVIRIFHSGLESYSSVESVVNCCKENIAKKIVELNKIVK